MRCRRIACNISVSEYKAHKEEQNRQSIRHLVKHWVEQCRLGISSCYQEFQHSVLCQASTNPHHKLTAPTNSQIHLMLKAFQMYYGNSFSTISIPEFFIATTSPSFPLEGSEESISHITPEQASGSAFPLRSISGPDVGHRDILVVQLPRKPHFKRVRWGWHCWPQTDTTVFGAMHTSCSWLPLWWRSGDHSSHFSPG